MIKFVKKVEPAQCKKTPDERILMPKSWAKVHGYPGEIKQTEKNAA